MKNLSVLLLGMALLSSIGFAGNISEADQKWLTVVEKMVGEGKTTVSTTTDERVKLAKNWAAKQGYSTEVAKTDKGFKVTFSKTLAQNSQN